MYEIEEIQRIVRNISKDQLKCREKVISVSSDRETGKGTYINTKITGYKMSDLRLDTIDLAIKEDCIIVNGYKSKCLNNTSKPIQSKTRWDCKFTDDSNPYNDILDIQIYLNNIGFDLEFILLNPNNHKRLYERIENTSGTWLNLIKENITSNISKFGLVEENTIYAGDIGSDIAELFITDDFRVYRKQDLSLYIGERVFAEFYESDAYVKFSMTGKNID